MTLFSFDDGALRIEHKRDLPQSNMRYFLHTHTNAELYYFLSGNIKIHIDDGIYNASSGDVFLIRPNEPHYFEVNLDSPYERIVINFDPYVFKNFDRNNYISNCFFARKSGEKNQYCASDFSDKSYASYITNMVNRVKNFETNVYSNLFMLLCEIADIFNSGTPLEMPVTDSFDSKIIRYVNDNLGKDLNIQLICDNFYISRSKLNNVFKRNTGNSVWEYVTAKRLANAKSMLTRGYPATKIAEPCGFSNYSTFYRAYKKYYGTYPSESKTSQKPQQSD